MSNNHKLTSKDEAILVNPEILDLEHLRQYTFGDRELEAELLGLFKLQILQQLEAIARAKTPADWKLATHTLKGSARGVGAHRIDKIADQLEMSGPGSDLTLLELACEQCLGVLETI